MQDIDPPPGRRPAGGAMNQDGKITRDAVLAAALELIDRDGVESLSMRRLGSPRPHAGPQDLPRFRVA